MGVGATDLLVLAEDKAGPAIDEGFFAVCLNTDPYTYLGNRPVSLAPGTSLGTPLTLVVLRRLTLRSVIPVAVAALVLTGEGSVDAQTLQGKTCAGVAAVAQRHGVPVLVLGGRITDEARSFASDSVALVAITPAGQPLEEALRRGPENLRRRVAAWMGRHRKTSDAAAVIPRG